MKRNQLLLLAVSAPLLLIAACDGDVANHTQTITGALTQSSFAAPVTTIKAHAANGVEFTALVDADGRFRVALPAGKNYRLDFVSAAGTARLVLPRKTGTLDWSFDVRGGGKPFDLGAVRYVGDPSGQLYSFVTLAHTAANPESNESAMESSEASESDDGDGEHDDGECEDGRDAAGAVCVDDDDEDEYGMCGGDDDDGRDDEGREDNDGENDDDGDDEPVSGGAVAEHNLPMSIGGCEDEDDDNDDDDSENDD